jgi:hypothetical protein
VTAEDSRRLTGSVDLDTTLQEKYPQDNRWDYGIGHRPTNRKDEMIYWIEVHSASAGQIKVVLAKLQWLKAWLGSSAQRLKVLHREFIWVSTGKTSFTSTSPQLKQFAQLGL